MNIIETNLKFGVLSRRKSTKRIILHHAAAAFCDAATIHRWHKNRGWSGAGYHFLVRKDGRIYRLRPENMLGAHASGNNSDSLGICFEGNFEVEGMPEAQKQSGKELVAYLKQKYGISKVQGHRDVGSTACPGKNFPFAEISGVPAGSVPVNPQPGGVGDISEDGWWGPKTTTKAQVVFGTAVDGIVSNQFEDYQEENPGLDSGWEWEDDPSGYSPLIKAIQKWCGSEQDGHIGPDTISDMQRKLGCAVDGCFSGPSPCIKKFQHWLNQQ